MSVKVELGFTSAGASAPFFRLNDAELGVLGNSEGVLGGGQILIDVTDFVRGFNFNRGKSRELDRFQAGQGSVTFNNNSRAFDPTFEDSPFAGQIEPRRQIRISLDDVVQYEGTIDDWNISYDAGGNSVATAQAFDGIANLANIRLEAFTPGKSGDVFILNDLFQGVLNGTDGLLGGNVRTGQAIDSALNNIGWPDDKRDIDNGLAIVEENPVPDGTIILDYLQTVATSEPSGVFISKSGDVKFIERNASFLANKPFLSDDGTGIPYTIVSVIFGTELLFNEIIVSNSETQVEATSETSINLYGKRDVTRNTVLNSVTQMEQLADFLVRKFDAPEFRFEVLEVDLANLSPSQRAEMVALELGDFVQVKFTPNDIPPAIERFGEVISISSTVSPTSEVIQIGLQSTQGALIVLDDQAFGKLDSESVLGF
jgi:hypothetical protein